MPNSIRAKFRVCTISNHYTYPQAAANGEICQEVNLTPVSGEGAEENKSFSKFTPIGKLDMNITNPAIKDFFEVGKEYYLDISPAE